MNYLKTANADVFLDTAVKLKVSPLGDNRYAAVIVDATGIENTLKRGTLAECKAYLEALKTDLKLTEVGGTLTYHWIDAPQSLRVIDGVIVTPDLSYDGQPLPSGATIVSDAPDVVKVVDKQLWSLTQGNAKITVTNAGISAEIPVEVVFNNGSGLSYSPKEVQVSKTVEMVLKVNHAVIDNLQVAWNSLDSSKASVDRGTLTGLAPGDVNITATYQGTTYVGLIKVIPTAPDPKEEDKAVKVGDTFTGVIPPTAGFSGARWESSNSGVATVVAGTGVVTIVGTGTCTITGSFVTPFVAEAIIYNITAQPKAPTAGTEAKTIKVKETFQGVLPPNKDFSGSKWVSSAGDKASVGQDGLVTGVAVGSATITGSYTLPYETPGVKYTVTIQPAAPTISSESKTVKSGTTLQGVMPTVAGFSGASWESDKTSVAIVDASSGLITMKGVGSCTITGSFTAPYKAPAKKYILTVEAAPETTLTVTPLTASGVAGGKQVLTITTNAPDFTIESSAEAIATVDKTTKTITFVKEGGCNVVVKAMATGSTEKTATVAVTVTAATPTK